MKLVCKNYAEWSRVMDVLTVLIREGSVPTNSFRMKIIFNTLEEIKGNTVIEERSKNDYTRFIGRGVSYLGMF